MLNPVASPSQFPRCPKCGLYLIIGDVTAEFLRAAKSKFGWRIGRFEAALPPAEWDAVRAGVRIQTCPRCKASVIDIVQSHMGTRS